MDAETIANEDLFQFWLMEMDNVLERFLGSLPRETREGLDYSVNSLKLLESWLLATYHSADEAILKSNSASIDGAARYVGETFTRRMGGRWAIDLKDEKNVFHGLPQLVGVPGQRAQICPLTLVVASTDRRTGKSRNGIR